MQVAILALLLMGAFVYWSHRKSVYDILNAVGKLSEDVGFLIAQTKSNETTIEALMLSAKNRLKNRLNDKIYEKLVQLLETYQDGFT
jgi:hypothetical protein